MRYYYIYLTINRINNKKYIGKHYGELEDNYLGSGTLLKKAFDKYGKENFYKKILYISSSEKENSEKEIEYIKKYNAIQDDCFYNIAEGGSGGFTTKGYSKEKRFEVNKKISIANSGLNHPMYGKHHSEETKQKLKESSLEYWTLDRRQERSEQYKGDKNPMYGKHHSEEAKQKMKESVIKKGKNKKIAKLNPDSLEIIQIYDTIREAERDLNVSHGYISRAIKSNYKAYGFRWKFVE